MTESLSTATQRPPRTMSREARRTQLKQLRRLFTENEAAITEALRADFGKPSFETYGTEIAFTIGEIDHALTHIDAWNKPTKVKVPLCPKAGPAETTPARTRRDAIFLR